jgi:RNA polymerase sigma-70 factor (ECF subfamily)
MENVPRLVDHFFRREAGRMVSYLTRIVGMGRLDLAEDIVQDTLCTALEAWPVRGLPDNPSAWLMRVARNKAIDMVRRDEHFRFIAPELVHLLRIREDAPAEEAAFEREIRDDQLRMMFSICHPELSLDAQITLILKTLCGFSVAEIANALLVSEDSIEKRLGRAKKVFRATGGFVEPSIAARMDAIHQAIYLLFSEGYHGSKAESTVRQDLCSEAIHLTLMLSEHPDGDQPKTHALLALLCFHAARLAGRTDDDGALIQLEMQDRSTWDQELIGRGFAALERSASGTELSAYHIEACIASLHCSAATYEDTKWDAILDLYDTLVRLKPTPVVALNRAIALGKAKGAAAGLEALGRIADADRLAAYPFYAAAEGEFHLLEGHPEIASERFSAAMALARSSSEAAFFARKLEGARQAR